MVSCLAKKSGIGIYLYEFKPVFAKAFFDE